MSTTQPVINKPVAPVFKSRSYLLFYHFRASKPLELVFEHTGTFHEAIERGRLHCQRCSYRFIKVRPFVVDLDEREQRIQDGYLDEL